jgi:hypothetical protein
MPFPSISDDRLGRKKSGTASLLLLSPLFPWVVIAFFVHSCVMDPSLSFVLVPNVFRPTMRHKSYLYQWSSENNEEISLWKQNVRDLRLIQERQICDSIMREQFLSPSQGTSTELLPFEMVGQAKMKLAKSSNMTSSFSSSTDATVLVLAPGAAVPSQRPLDRCEAILVPMTSPYSQLRLLSFANSKQPIKSLTLLLSLNTLLINRDGALFDNLPWSTWSKDPQKRNRDAAGNPIADKFHLGKRDAYNRFMGKDWPGRSLALDNLAMRLKYMSEQDGRKVGGVGNDNPDVDEADSKANLAKRIVELRIRESQMEIAEIDSQLAIARNNPDILTEDEIRTLEIARADLQESIQDAKDNLKLLSSERTNGTLSTKRGIVDHIALWMTQDVRGKDNEAPYRGAMGYPPKIDSRRELEQSFFERSYRSPFDLLKEILDDQLNAKVIGCALENTSLLRGNLVLGGAIVIQRKIVTKTTRIAGEEVDYQDEKENFGNEGLPAGEVMVVECDVDEAIGIALACDLPLQVEQSIYQAASVAMELSTQWLEGTDTVENKKSIIPLWNPQDTSILVQVEGDTDADQRAARVSLPRTTASLFDSIFEQKQSSSTALFPTDNPIRSLEQLDGLENADKAKTLLGMSNFKGRLPRPRVVRSAPTNENPLDQLLLPLIDESVRKQYQLRQAEQNGDLELVQQLRDSKSKLQLAKEQANVAKLKGNEELANYWEEEARFLETLRADVTQDVGSYSRFLDRDDWYERDRQRTAKRANKSSFGNLLDGIE